MSVDRFPTLESVIQDPDFPDLDLALRRGAHVERGDAAWYALLTDAQDLLEPFYRRYGSELVHRSDGYFYLLPTGERIGRRQLSAAEMLVGQGLALLYLDPSTVENGGVVARDQVLSHLAGVVGAEALVRALNPKRRRLDERVAAETVRSRVGDALRKLATLGFLEALEAESYRLRTPLLRFAEPLRGAGSPEAQLAALVEAGDVVVDEGANEGDEDGTDEDPDAELTDEGGVPDEDPG